MVLLLLPLASAHASKPCDPESWFSNQQRSGNEWATRVKWIAVGTIARIRHDLQPFANCALADRSACAQFNHARLTLQVERIDRGQVPARRQLELGRSAPHRRFSIAMRRMRWTTSGEGREVPGGFRRERPPLPPQPEAFSVPAQKRIGLDEHEGVAPVRQHRGEGHQQGAFRGAKLRLLDASGGNQELLAKEGVLREELPFGAYEISEEPPGNAAGPGSQHASRANGPTDDGGHAAPQ